MGVVAEIVFKARGGPCVFLAQQLGWLERLAGVGAFAPQTHLGT